MSEVNKKFPVFIIGCPRSGTSALSWAIAQHPGFSTSAESDFLHHLFGSGKLHAAFKESVDRSDEGWLKKHGVGYKEFCRHMGVGIDQLFRSRYQGRNWVDSTPGHTLMADALAYMFPEAKFINIIRDGRAVVSSMLKSGFEKMGFGMEWTQDFEAACKAWVHYVEKGHEFTTGNAERSINIINENMIADPEQTFRDIFVHLDTDYCEAAATFISKKRLNSSYDAGIKTVVSVESTVRAEPWQEWTDEQRKMFDEICGETMHQIYLPLKSAETR